MKTPESIARAARLRIQSAEKEIQAAKTSIQAGTPLKAEPETDRAVRRVAAVTGVGLETAKRIVNYESPAALGLAGESLKKAEAIQGTTVDYVGVAWLAAGQVASSAVGRVIYRSGAPEGTGFLVSSRLLLTNHHVIPDPQAAQEFLIEFRYEKGLDGRPATPVRLELDPSTFFVTDSRDDLDYTLVALRQPSDPAIRLQDFGCLPLSASSAKHSIGEPVNIIQHPDGDFKQLVIRENRILHRGDTVLHYVADTEPGASGSPVCNDEWHVVALHHWGAPHRERTVGGRILSTDVNEGIRVSAIVAELQQRAARMTESQRRLLAEALRAPTPADFGSRRLGTHESWGWDAPFDAARHASNQERDQDAFQGGEAEARQGAPANRIDRRYSNRRGYNEQFLPNFPVPMPQLNASQRSVAARVRGVGVSANPYEIKYQHFSVVLHAQRRMAFYSICNIDGSKRIRVDRETGQAVSGPEATETWALDPRVEDDAQLSDAFYARLRRDLRTPRDFFARGHLTRREDPNWGREDFAERANDDTFHHPNACPQVNNAFNSSQRAWQGIENYVLNSADDSNLRVTVITGPVFHDDDPVYEDEVFGAVPLPRQFWKIVARVEDGSPKVFAVLADQSAAMESLLAARPEALWDWPRRLSTEYISTVDEIATLTGLDFGNLADHDIFAGQPEGRRVLHSADALFPHHARRTAGGFGRFASIDDFLEAWEHKRRQVAEEDEEAEGAERRGRRRNRPQPRPRKVAEIEARVERIFADDLSGAKHQQFTVIPTKWISGDASAKSEVTATIEDSLEVRVAVRFGDSRGLADRIPGIRSNVELHIKGEWINAEEAFDVGGEDLAVLHFTHDPLGWICTPAECYS